ncbi:nucleotidyltransferase family protein [Epibacterium ulvae]|nr:nucleotidyltransferase family protein [Epibacterium ulvae]
MIFAAGFGTRMGPLTADRPKPMIEVAGRPLIDHALDLVNAIDAPTIVANTHYLGDQVRTHVEPQGVLISHEEPDVLDTGGGLKQALPLLGDGPVLTLNPDVIWSGPNPLETVINAWDPSQMDALLLCIPLKRTIGRIGSGDFTISDTGRPSRGGNMVYGGVQIIKTDSLRDIQDDAFSLNVVWDRMNSENRLYCAEYPGKWCDVGRAECIPLAENLIASDV